MNYIGSKLKLSTFILTTVKQVVGNDLSDKVFCDLFAGTGIVGRTFKTEVNKVISNDWEYYSYVLNKNYIENTQHFEYQNFIDTLNQLHGTDGFIFQEYSEQGKANRLYFNEYNGKKIDAMRQQIEIWYTENKITTAQYYFLLASLLESADKVANTASVYGAFLKKIKQSAQQDIVLKPAFFDTTRQQNEVFQEDSNTLIKKISGDILYIDPPYNTRQYGANYHLLNTIANYKSFEPQGFTGLTAYQRSQYCSKQSVAEVFEDVIQNAKFDYIFMSYNNEGLLSQETIEKIMSKYGQYKIKIIDYQRFKSDKDQNRNHLFKATKEYLHILIKE